MLHRSPTLSILHDMLQPNGLADSHNSFDHRERLWCAATAAPTASTRGRPAGRQQPRVMLLADVEIAGDVEIQPRWRVLLSCELGESQKNSRRVRQARKNRRRRGSHCVALLGTSVKRSRQHALAPSSRNMRRRAAPSPSTTSHHAVIQLTACVVVFRVVARAQNHAGRAGHRRGEAT